jgi:hypothetical protein
VLVEVLEQPDGSLQLVLLTESIGPGAKRRTPIDERVVEIEEDQRHSLRGYLDQSGDHALFKSRNGGQRVRTAGSSQLLDQCLARRSDRSQTGGERC